MWRIYSNPDPHGVGSLRYFLKNEGSVSQQVWYVKEHSLLKAISAKQRSTFAALYEVEVTAAR
jgi:hypothetical protein